VSTKFLAPYTTFSRIHQKSVSNLVKGAGEITGSDVSRCGVPVLRGGPQHGFVCELGSATYQTVETWEI